MRSALGASGRQTRAVVERDADEPALIDWSRCNGCGDCLPACPYAAIALSNGHMSNGRGARIGTA